MNTTQTTIETSIIEKDYWYKVSIIEVSYGFTQRLNGGKWENTTTEPQRQTTIILTLGRYFSTLDEAIKFTLTKSYKSLFNNVTKNWA